MIIRAIIQAFRLYREQARAEARVSRFFAGAKRNQEAMRKMGHAAIRATAAGHGLGDAWVANARAMSKAGLTVHSAGLDRHRAAILRNQKTIDEIRADRLGLKAADYPGVRLILNKSARWWGESLETRILNWQLIRRSRT